MSYGEQASPILRSYERLIQALVALGIIFFLVPVDFEVECVRERGRNDIVGVCTDHGVSLMETPIPPALLIADILLLLLAVVLLTVNLFRIRRRKRP